MGHLHQLWCKRDTSSFRFLKHLKYNWNKMHIFGNGGNMITKIIWTLQPLYETHIQIQQFQYLLNILKKEYSVLINGLIQSWWYCCGLDKIIWRNKCNIFFKVSNRIDIIVSCPQKIKHKTNTNKMVWNWHKTWQKSKTR